MSTEASYRIDEFCKAERISRAMLYKLWSQQKGPRFYYVGSVRRISHEARLEWQQRFEVAADSSEAAHRGEIPTIRIGSRILVLKEPFTPMLEGSQ